MGIKVEDALVRELAVQLERTPAVRRAWPCRKPSASRPFKAEVLAQLGYLPVLQPEIDLCLLLADGSLLGIEAKLFRGSARTYRSPFYEGIGQALALNRYGFDYSGLWFIFEDSAAEKALHRYGAEAWGFVRNDMNLPLEFTYLAAKIDGDAHRFEVMQYTGRQEGIVLLPIDHRRFKLSCKHPNPMRDQRVPKVLRSALESWLEVER